MAFARASKQQGGERDRTTPQFQEKLSLLPSRLPSPLASLCFWLYAHRSCSVKPSCAITKLMPWYGFLQPPKHKLGAGRP